MLSSLLPLVIVPYPGDPSPPPAACGLSGTTLPPSDEGAGPFASTLGARLISSIGLLGTFLYSAG